VAGGREITWVEQKRTELVRLPPGDALAAGWSETVETVRATGAIFFRVGKGEISPRDSVSGPIGIAGMAYDLASSGPSHLLWLLGLMGISLALINFLPIPVLDGGHMMFLVWEAVTRRPPSLRVLEVGQVIGLAVIACLFILAFWNDISKLLR
jgi:regulator of sigma E protease